MSEVFDLNIADLIDSAPSTGRSNLDAFGQWLFDVGQIASEYHDNELQRLVDVANDTLFSGTRRAEYRAKILPRLKMMSECDEYHVMVSEEAVVYNMNEKPAVFIVHGHDNGLKSEVARFLERLNFEAVILHERANKGQTIIEKLLSEIDRIKFGVVLYTADDVMQSGQKRARQNVVFEHGVLIGRLGKDRVCVIVDDDVERPSDSDGIVYISRTNWKNAVADELRAAGLPVDKNLI